MTSDKGVAREPSKTLFDPNATVQKMVLPSQSTKSIRKDPIQTSDNRRSARDELPSSSAKLLNLKEIYARICKHETHWASHPHVLDFKKRLELCDLYTEIMLTDYKLALKYDLDARQWKNIVYNIFNVYRSKFHGMDQKILNEWNQFLTLAAEALADLANRLEAKKSKIPVWVSPLSHLGDISRYQAEYLCKNDDTAAEERWKSAQNWYKQASFISPGNGLLWNQLGIVARARSFYLNAIFNYMRALCVKNPFSSSKDALLELYHFFVNDFDIDNNHSKSSLALEKVQIEQVRKVEVSFIKLQSALYTKVGLDGFKKLQARFSNNLLESKPHLNMLSISQQLEWWFQLSVIMICNFSLIQHHSSFDEQAKKILLEYAMKSLVDILNIITSSTWNSEGQNIFICTMLLWISCNTDMSEELIKVIRVIYLIF